MSAKHWKIYKPNNKKNGSACQFNIQKKEGKFANDVSVFIKVAEQLGEDENGNASFYWNDREHYIDMKLGEPDISDILAVLYRYKQKVGQAEGKFSGSLFHQNDKGNSSIAFSVSDYGYNMRISRKEGDKLLAINCNLTLAEGVVLRLLLEDAIKTTYEWN